jgi:branched-chain amino acid transport system permease protein
MLTILLDGLAYGMLLFVLASGLSVTLGLMNFINLAHGAFAMIGGYVTALLMNRAGVPFLATLPAAFVIPSILGVILERTLYRRLYGASPLDQVLFTIGPHADGDADRRLSHRRRAGTGSFAGLA